MPFTDRRSFRRQNIRETNSQAGPLCRSLLHNGPGFHYYEHARCRKVCFARKNGHRRLDRQDRKSAKTGSLVNWQIDAQIALKAARRSQWSHSSFKPRVDLLPQQGEVDRLGQQPRCAALDRLAFGVSVKR
jgi:hypothetical protein